MAKSSSWGKARISQHSFSKNEIFEFLQGTVTACSSDVKFLQYS